MRVNLFVNYYLDKSVERQAELDLAVKQNIHNKLIDYIIVLCDITAAKKWLLYSAKIKLIFISTRPTFNNLFAETQRHPNGINIIANTDIYFDETLQHVRDYPWNDRSCMALSRWDLLPDGRLEHFNRMDTNDCWIFKGAVPEIAGADFTLGRPGSDNKILYLLNQAGYHITNPSMTIQTIHLHQSGVRNYVPSDILLPPYHFVNPTTL